MNRFRSTTLSWFYLLALWGVFPESPAQAAYGPSLYSLVVESVPGTLLSEEPLPTASSKTIIIKFKSSSPLAKQVEKLFKNKQAFKDVIHTSYLDDLNKKYKLKKIEALYLGPGNQKPKENFKSPTHGVLKKVKTPFSEALFIFTFEKDIDPFAVSDAYSRSAQVEYAHPDFAITVYSEQIHD